YSVNHTATTEASTLSLHDALPISEDLAKSLLPQDYCVEDCNYLLDYYRLSGDKRLIFGGGVVYGARDPANIEAIIRPKMLKTFPDRKSTRLNSSHVKISYAVFCLK